MITGLLFIALMAMFITSFTGCPFIVSFATLVTVSVFVSTPKGALRMAVEVEVWQNDIIGNLFKDNSFAAKAVSADQYVLNGKIVHIPRAGAPSASVKNPNAFPINAVQRSDDDIFYPLDVYAQPPKFVQNVEQAQLSYDKRQSIMGEQMSQLIEDAMNGVLIRWQFKATTIGTDPANYELTTGGNTAATAPNATGQRKLFTKDVVGKIKLRMDIANIPADGRYAVLTANHYQQFLDSLSDAAQTNFYRLADMQKGVIGSYLGIQFMMRSTVSVWRKTGAVWAPVDTQAAGYAASDQTGDSAASLFWQESCVERARGDIGVFDNPGRAEYYGDVMSMNMRVGARQRRTEGVIALIEDIVAA